MRRYVSAVESLKDRLRHRVHQFLVLVETPSWREFPDGLACEIGIFFDEPPFSLKSASQRPDGTNIHLEYSGDADTAAGLTQDFFQRLARGGGKNTFTRYELRDDCFLVEIVAGDNSHGHFIEVRVTGPGVDRVRENLRRYLEEEARRLRNA